MDSISKLKEYLESKNVKPSYARLKVLEYIVENKNHPTAEQIYSELIIKMPTLSKTTIYNALKVFVEGKMAIPLNIDSNETRYDVAFKEHGHFKCDQCEGIYDFEIDENKGYKKGLNGFKINSISIYYKGLCPECCKKNE